MVAAATASAPGKLVLTGEYAVLDGATAVAAATDIRALAAVAPSGYDTHRLIIVNTNREFAFKGGFTHAPEWVDDPGEYGGIMNALLEHLRNVHNGFEPPPLAISIDTRDFYLHVEGANVPVKRGIGSSGAVTVALAGALCAALDRPLALADVLAVHHQFQGRVGSGIDVVTSWQGGTVALTPNDPAGPQSVERPANLLLRPVWTGEPASTPAMLAGLAAFRAADPDLGDELMQALCRLANAAAAAWQTGDTQSILQAVHDYSLGLQAFDATTATGIWSGAHRELLELAGQAGVVYKPSGAGGGDYGLAFAADAQALEKFTALAQDAGYADAAPGWSDTGLEIELSS